MKVVILCGGFGTRISEETHLRPKPMVEIGGKPMLWHIMNYYASYGFNDFILALGYKSEFIKNYFLNYYALKSDFVVDMNTGDLQFLKKPRIDWKISLVDTGLETMTGGRVLRLQDYLREHGTFMLTYGDGLSNINLHDLVKFHRDHGKLATVSAVRPTARFGEVTLENETVMKFKEKPQAEQGWINGGFFVMEPEALGYFPKGDDTILEKKPLENLADGRQLMAFQHTGFWQCMDTIRDKNYLESLWKSKDVPWSGRQIDDV